MANVDDNDPRDPDRQFAHLSDAEIQKLKGQVDREMLARSFVAMISSPDGGAEFAREFDQAKIGILVFDALEIELSPPVAARHLGYDEIPIWSSDGDEDEVWFTYDGKDKAEINDVGNDKAVVIRFGQSLQRWARLTGGDPVALKSRISRLTGQSVDWKQMGYEAVALEKEARRMGEWADKEERRKNPNELIVERRRVFEAKLVEEAQQKRKLLDRRGWTNGRSHLAERDFVLDLISIVLKLRPEMEIHARPQTVWDEEKGDEVVGLPGNGFPAFVESVRAYLHDRPHVPEGWQRATENAVRFWKKRYKAEPQENS